MSEQLVIEGTWEEIAAHAGELAGRKVRLMILDAGASTPFDAAKVEAGEREYRADPIFEAEEISAPFDLPRPGPGVPVPVRKGGIRLPDIPAECLKEDYSRIGLREPYGAEL